MSSFSGLNTALTSLYTQRKALDVTGQNVANANTIGYTRQRVTMQSVGAGAVPAIHSTYSGTGGGVAATDVLRLRDAFLEARGQQEHGKSTHLAERAVVHMGLEDLFGEPGDTGLQAQLADFWGAWGDVANQPGDKAARSSLLQSAGTVVDTMASTHDAITTRWQATREELVAVAQDVTTTAATVAQLNEAIKRGNQAGLSVNELSDQRDVLVMRLSEMVGATSRPTADGVVDVYIGGTALVRGATSESLQVLGATDMSGSTTDPIQLGWAGGGYPAAVTSGAAAGKLDALGSVLPDYAARLDTVAATLASSVNAVHATAYALDGTQTGAFFTGTTAKSLTVAITDPTKVAASAHPGGSLDGSVAGVIGKLSAAAGGADAVYRDMIVNLGSASQTALRRSEIQDNVTLQIDAARDSQAGVDLDEEMVNLTMYQRAYEAASRMINAVDETLDTLINRTGHVGR